MSSMKEVILQQLRKETRFLTNRSTPLASPKTTTASSTEKYYTAKPNETFKDGRYQAIRQLGRGQYSHVWLAKDLQKQSFIALKILTSDCYGTDHDIFEIEILKTITKEQTQNDRSHVVSLLDQFQLQGPGGRQHECIAMPVLGCNIATMAERFPQDRIPVRIMKEITRQLLTSLAFLHERCNVIHTDLQPSNICFEIESSRIEGLSKGASAGECTPTVTEANMPNISIIDLGVASWVDKHLSNNIQPEHLRAPEVILGAPWGPPVDIWSLGCLVIEFIKGHIAFPGSAHHHGTWTSEDDHLALQMEILGQQMPRELLQRGKKTSEYFDEHGNLLRIPKLNLYGLKAMLDGTEGIFQRPGDMRAEDVDVFVDFVRGALALDSDHRATARQLLGHEWLRG